jgi:hypothetical protein
LTPRLALTIAAFLTALGGCGGSNPQLMNFPRSPAGPDEFLVAPAKPLQAPPDPRALPPPTLGGTNRADPTPNADAIAALGGNPARVAPGGGIPASDSALIAHSGRFGREPTIRQTLAQEDQNFRINNQGRLLERLANINVYYNAYDSQSLDQQAEMDRFRRAGVPTPAAPPAALVPR